MSAFLQLHGLQSARLPCPSPTPGVHPNPCPLGRRSQRQQPTRLPNPWDSPGNNTGVGCHFLLQCVKVKLLSRNRLLATPWTAAHQAPLPMGFSRQGYWSSLPFLSPGDLPDPGIKPGPPALGAWILSHWTTREVPVN